MKTILLSILAALVLFVPNAAAHTYLDTTKPENGEVVVEPLQSISLTYAGKIEQGSTFKVITANGEQMETSNMTLVDGVLTGSFDNPLPNGDYTVQWNSISEDGHPLSGEFSFTVNAPETEEAEENVEQAEVEDSAQVDVSESEPVSVEDDKNNMPLLVVGGMLLAIIFISIIILLARKKTK
ncbi:MULTISPECIES: copper resistance CopC family protein [Solibacillus]|uniref:Copper resistance protein CopC n=1 Tax=Solibacillus faecavium TaxID=2762221 RepID=A0ABR8XVB0_9BACL|nr:copper resistance protein CopC [Solibacillus faecavium]MBD8035875.1 copper resistance protein CopC [Solibacillus faecavium]